MKLYDGYQDRCQSFVTSAAKISGTLLVTCSISSPDCIQHSFTQKELIDGKKLDSSLLAFSHFNHYIISCSF